MIFLWLDCELFQDLDCILNLVKSLPTSRETQVGSLGWEDPLEKEMAMDSSTLALKIPWTEEPGRLQSIGSQRIGHDWETSLYYLYSCNSAQCKMGIQCWTWKSRLVPGRERSMPGLILSPCLFNLYAEYIMRNAGLDEAQAGIKIAGKNINNLR